MKTALITTTVNIPTVLALYRKLGPDVSFFVAADEKTPEIAGKKAICSGCKAETDNYMRDRWWTSQTTLRGWRTR